MATEPVKPPVGDPLGRLHLNMFCDAPHVADLSTEQKCALHEFFHEVLAAGYRLYQKVPPDKAGPIIKQKFGLVLDDAN